MTPQEFQQLLQSMNPQQQQQQSEMAGLDSEQSALDAQLARAHEIRKGRMGVQSYGAMAGIGNGLAAAFDGMNQSKLDAKQPALNKKRTDYMAMLVDKLRARALQPDPVAQQPQAQPPPPDPGFQGGP